MENTSTAVLVCNAVTLTLVLASWILGKKLKNKIIAETLELTVSGMAFGVVVGNLIHVFLR
jgi:hypothetical protein